MSQPNVSTAAPDKGLAPDISIADLGKLIGGETVTPPSDPPAEPAPPAEPPAAEPPKAEPQQEQQEPEAAAVEQTPAAEPEPKPEGEEHTPEPQQEHRKKKSAIDERLSKLAQKRRDAELEARDQRERAERLERELEALKNAQPGPAEPAAQPKPANEPAADDPEPDLKTFVDQTETYDDAVVKYTKAYREWSKRQDQREQQRQTEAQTAETQRQGFLKDWQVAMDEHPDFEDAVGRVRAVAPEGLQKAISQIPAEGDKAVWPAVTMYLDEHPEELSALSQQFAANPYAAIAKLGRIAASLSTPAPKTVAQSTPPKTAPNPPAKVGGTAAPAPIDLEKAPIDVFMREIPKYLG